MHSSSLRAPLPRHFRPTRAYESTGPAPGGRGAPVGAGARATVHLATITDGEVAAYGATAEPLQVAGGFTIDGLGGPFISGIEGDHHNVVGISLPLLREMLGEINLSWFDLSG